MIFYYLKTRFAWTQYIFSYIKPKNWKVQKKILIDLTRYLYLKNNVYKCTGGEKQYYVTNLKRCSLQLFFKDILFTW